jgi:DNA-binding response OmpR family regulator
MKRVLVVMGAASGGDVLFQNVGACGFKVIGAPGGRAAFRQAAMLKPHLVLVVLPLPDMSLSELISKLAGTERTAAIPIVAVVSDVGGVAGLEASLADVLEPGIDMAALKRRLDAVLAKHVTTADD